ncbi:MAG: peptide chain release factor-like protein [Planctomycetota bacterium]|nr:MAG: peptide chain release factor-like protein [Planctomycetota bacterium]
MDQTFATDRETLERAAVLRFIRSSGPGGQHRNKAETGVRLFHPPSGITVAATERRSQFQNRELAFERLIAKLEDRNRKRKPRVPTARPKAAERTRLEQKRRRGTTKQERRDPEAE